MRKSFEDLYDEWLLDGPDVPDVPVELTICPACSGSGEGMVEWSRCYECRGTGEVWAPIEYEEDDDE